MKKWHTFAVYHRGKKIKDTVLRTKNKGIAIGKKYFRFKNIK